MNRKLINEHANIIKSNSFIQKSFKKLVKIYVNINKFKILTATRRSSRQGEKFSKKNS